MLRNILKNVKRPAIDFTALKKSRKPNTYLVAPIDYCPFAPGEESPVYNIDAVALSKMYCRVIEASQNIEKLSEEAFEDGTQVDYVQYTKGLGFPDTITLRFMDKADGQSTVAIYSRSHYGYRDFGVNRKRVKNWMQQVTGKLAS